MNYTRGTARSVPCGTRAARAALLALALGCGACASLPPPSGDKPASAAIPMSPGSALGALVQAAAPGPRISGFRLLDSGADAFASLLTLADHAQRSLDLQYYLVENDASGRTILKHVYEAAQRGVRVRILLDDLNTSGADDSLLCLSAHAGIELRLYNPFPAGRFSTLSRIIASLTDMRRINQRMHNKSFIADNAVAVTGGRNLGDAYFAHSAASNFLDLDVIAAGPVVRRLSRSFDGFWNSALAYPIRALVRHRPECAGMLPATPTAAQPVFLPVPDGELARELRETHLDFDWVPSRLLADDPSKISDRDAPVQDDAIPQDLISLMRAAQHEVVVISPYFVAGRRGVELARALHARGVRLRILTNSLASTDAPVVHIGYARYRQALLAAGAELYELRSQPDAPRGRFLRFGSSRSSLHAKAMVVDRATVLVGSMNMDARSANLNTELGIEMRSPLIAAQVLDLFDDVVAADSYRVTLSASGRLRWTGSGPDAPAAGETEPGAGPGLRLMLLLLSPFAPDELL